MSTDQEIYSRYDAGNELPRVSIEVTRGRCRKRLREMTGSAFLIGAADDCDLVLRDGRFPDVHAYLIRRLDGVSLRYLGSKPALTVNDRLLRCTAIEDGDCLRTGPFEFLVHVEPARSPLRPSGRSIGRLSLDLRSTEVHDAYAYALGEVLQLLCEVKDSVLENSRPFCLFTGPTTAGPQSGVAV